MTQKGFKAGSKELESEARRMAKTVSDSLGEGAKVALQKQTDAFVKLNQQYANQEQKVKDLASKLHDLQRQKVETAEFKELSKDLDKAKASLDRLYERRDAYAALGKETPPKLELDISDAERKIRILEADIKELVATDKAYVPVDTSKVKQEIAAAEQKQMQMYSALQNAADTLGLKITQNVEKEESRARAIQEETAEEERLAQIRENAIVGNQRIVEVVARRKQLLKEIADMEAAGIGTGYQQYDLAKQELAEVEQKIRDYSNGIKEAKESYKKLGDIVKKTLNSLGNVLKKINSAVNNFGKRIKNIFSKFTKSASSAGRSTNGLVFSLKNILKYGFGIRSLYVLINKLRSAIKEGFDNLYNDINVTAFKNQVDSLKASILTLKNSFAAAFRPIVEIAIPYIQKLIDYMISLMNVASQFMAAITGQKKYTKAIKQTTAAIEDQNKAQNKQLSNLDNLNNLTSDAGGTGADGGGNIMFEEVPIENSFKNIADSIKDLLSRFFEPLKKAWNSVGKKVMGAWKKALNNVWSLIKDIGRDFLKVWQEERTLNIFKNILEIVKDIGLAIAHLAENFRKAWNENNTGLKILQNIRNIIDVIIANIKHAADTTVEWAKNIDFTPLLRAFERFTKSLEPVADALSGILTDFYEQVLLPLGKWTLEKGLPALLQVFIDFNNKVDWEALRSNLAEFWKHLEPFAETVGGGLILFIRDVSDALAGFLNSQQFKNFLKTVSDWMDKVTPRDVADGLEKLAKAVISVKLALLGFKVITSAAKGLTMAKAFFAIWGAGSGAAMAGEMTAAAGGIGGLSTALAAFASNAALAVSAAGVALAAFEPFKKLTTDFDDNAEVRFYEEYKGINGTLKLFKDNFKDFANDISTFGNAMETVNEGIILTDEQMRKLSQSTAFCNDDIESLTEGMVDLHPELAEIRKEFGLWDAYPETLSNIAQGVGLIKDGTVDAGKAFDEFKKPMWNMTEDALTFFGQIQDGTISVSNAHRAMNGEIRHNSSEMKTSIVADNSEISVSNDALNDNYSNNADSVTTAMSNVIQGSDDLKDTFASNNKDINISNDGAAQNFSDNADRISDKVNDISGTLDDNKGGFSSWAESVMVSLKSVWESAKLWLGKVIDKIGEVMSSIGSTLSGAFSGSGGSTAAFSGKASAFSMRTVNTPYAANPAFAALSSVEIPKLATGAVIPANREFLAVLGDQKQGTNVEAPLEMIKQANKEGFLEVLNQLGLSSGGGGQEINLNLTVECEGYRLLHLIQKLNTEYFKRTGRYAFI